MHGVIMVMEIQIQNLFKFNSEKKNCDIYKYCAKNKINRRK